MAKGVERTATPTQRGNGTLASACRRCSRHSGRSTVPKSTVFSGEEGFLTVGKVNCHRHGLGVGAKIDRFSGREGGGSDLKVAKTRPNAVDRQHCGSGVHVSDHLHCARHVWQQQKELPAPALTLSSRRSAPLTISCDATLMAERKALGGDLMTETRRWKMLLTSTKSKERNIRRTGLMVRA